MLLAIDIGGTNYSVALVTDDGAVVHKIHRPTQASGGRRWMLPQVKAAAQELLRSAPERPRWCGIGFGGPVNFPTQVIRRSMHVGGWSDFPLSSHLSAELGIRCVMDNDANAAALGEFAWGAARGTRSMVYLTISTGIGGGLVLDGEVYRGAQSFAGEFGHTKLVQDGPPCACGLRGCVEAVCSGTALGKAVRAEAKRRPRAWAKLVKAAGGVAALEAKSAFDAARGGHAGARALVAQYCDDLGRGLVNLLAILNPECIVIGGGVSLAGDTLFVPLRRAIARQLPPYLPREWRCVPAALGRDSVLCGAAQLALRHSQSRKKVN